MVTEGRQFVNDFVKELLLVVRGEHYSPLTTGTYFTLRAIRFSIHTLFSTAQCS